MAGSSGWAAAQLPHECALQAACNYNPALWNPLHGPSLLSHMHDVFLPVMIKPVACKQACSCMRPSHGGTGSHQWHDNAVHICFLCPWRQDAVKLQLAHPPLAACIEQLQVVLEKLQGFTISAA